MSDHLKLDVPKIAQVAVTQAILDLAKQTQIKLEKAKSEYLQLESEWKDISRVLSQLQTTGDSKYSVNDQPQIWVDPKGNTEIAVGYVPITDQNGEFFNSEWSWAKKITYVLQREGRALSSKEICNYILNKYDVHANPEKVKNSIPATLSVASKEGKFKKDASGTEIIYDLP